VKKPRNDGHLPQIASADLINEFAETTIRVRYAETDQMGVVYHANFFTWFEVGRVEWCRRLGFDYKKMELEDDSHIVVADSHCRFKRPARFDDILVIRTRLIQSQRRTVRFGYEIVNQDSGEVLAIGETLHVICDRRGRPKSLPEKYRHFFGLDAHQPSVPAAKSQGAS